MNKHLQNIVNIIQQDERLSVEQKDGILKSLKDADKELEIVNFKLERTEKVKRTTAILLEETIEELEQKRKAAEAHNRELEIEAALERVRSRSMGMQRGADLKGVVKELYDQLKLLGFKLGVAAIQIIDVHTGDMDVWMEGYEDGYELPEKYHVPYFDHPGNNKHLEHWKKGNSYAVVEMSGQEKIAYDNYFFFHTDFAKAPEKTKIFMMSQESLATSMAYMKYGAIGWAPSVLDEEQASILQRFAKVFEQTYTRFLDLQKAEAQARESQIQLALERVRARTMAMQSSDELAEVSFLLNKQVVELGIPTRGCAFNIYGENESTEWFSNLDGTLPSYKTPREKIFFKYYEAGQRGESLLIEEFSKERIKQHYDYLHSLHLLGNDDEVVEKIRNAMPDFQIDHVAYFKYGYLLFITLVPAPEAHDVFKRFAKEFEQTYTRFLDLKKAEAQARESQIEAALEKIRSRSLAMHHSDELSEVIGVTHKTLAELDVKHDTIAFQVFDFKNQSSVFWPGNNLQSVAPKVVLPYDEIIMKEDTCHRDLWHAITTGDSIINKVYTRKQKDRWFEYVFAHNDNQVIEEHARQFINNAEIHTVCFFPEKYSGLFADSWDGSKYLEEDLSVLKRVARAFEQAYVRFLDLQKAEAQAREAQIEAALERVRSKTMAMHKSEQLPETAQVLFEQFAELGKIPDRISIGIIKEELQVIEWWATDQMGSQLASHFNSTILQPTIAEFFTAWKEGKDSTIVDISGEALKEWIAYVREEVKMPIDDSKIKGRRVHHAAFFSQGLLLISAHEPMPKETMQLLVRFAKVFSQTYTRFLDLQKAEAQAREAQIEASLERVRAQAMAMHHSEDLGKTIQVYFEQLDELIDSTIVRCGAGLLMKDSTIAIMSTASKTPEGEIYSVRGIIDMKGHPMLENTYAHWLVQKEFNHVLRGNEIQEYYQYITNQVAIQENRAEDELHFYFPMFTEGSFYVVTNSEVPENELQVFRRFSSVLSLTYKRFNDLQKAEAQTKEVVRQSSLDRIRGEIASMRTTNDLERITPLIWKELTTLNIPFIRCGVFIMDESQQLIHTFLSTPDGKAIAAFHLPYNAPSRTNEIIVSWKNKQSYIEHWDETDFSKLGDLLFQQGALPSKEGYLKTVPQGGLYLHCIPFQQGMLYVGNTEELIEEDIQLIQSVGDAFATAYARYEDFNKLEAAKQQVENTLADLKQAQQQLVQSEKMASLGELTAGIAHEIQNPLNFVNNFSEVSTELVKEMLDEVAKGNSEEVKAIAFDVVQNLEKINHHGKRAADIVKGMLQHSRSSSGQKELTDINALADEYLRLAYHGLRAKDKSFNATMNTDYDETIEPINVIPQDIGRVILNLITNAFYAVNEKAKQGIVGYEPTVSVNTKKENNKVLISVKDNGNGIPDSIKEKIFQPFFTTKPTGQGTGLGLSLSYDIVKAHGGEFKVATHFGEGSDFTIQLPAII